MNIPIPTAVRSDLRHDLLQTELGCYIRGHELFLYESRDIVRIFKCRFNYEINFEVGTFVIYMVRLKPMEAGHSSRKV